MENSGFSNANGIWWYTETPLYNYTNYVYVVSGKDRKLDSPNAYASRGVRPAIEVPLKNISY